MKRKPYISMSKQNHLMVNFREKASLSKTNIFWWSCPLFWWRFLSPRRNLASFLRKPPLPFEIRIYARVLKMLLVRIKCVGTDKGFTFMLLCCWQYNLINAILKIKLYSKTQDLQIKEFLPNKIYLERKM